MNAPTGFTARPGTLEDAAAAAELMNAFDRAYLEEPDTVDAAEVAGWWARIELDLDSRFYFDAQTGWRASLRCTRETKDGSTSTAMCFPSKRATVSAER